MTHAPIYLMIPVFEEYHCQYNKLNVRNPLIVWSSAHFSMCVMSTLYIFTYFPYHFHSAFLHNKIKFHVFSSLTLVGTCVRPLASCCLFYVRGHTSLHCPGMAFLLLCRGSLNVNSKYEGQINYDHMGPHVSVQDALFTFPLVK